MNKESSICIEETSDENSNFTNVSLNKDRIRWTNEIYNLLPYFDKYHIYRKFYKIVDKVDVLSYFIQKGVNKHHYISDIVFKTLDQWQNNGTSSQESNIQLGLDIDTRNLKRYINDEIDFMLKLMLDCYTKEHLLSQYSPCKNQQEIENVTISLMDSNMAQYNLESNLNVTKIKTEPYSKPSTSYSACDSLSSSLIETIDVDSDKVKIDVIQIDDEYNDTNDVQIVHDNNSKLDNTNGSLKDFLIEDEQLWEDAHQICEVVPNVQLNDIYEDICKLSTNPQRKLILIDKYISGQTYIPNKQNIEKRSISPIQNIIKKQKLTDLNKLVPNSCTVSYPQAVVAGSSHTINQQDIKSGPKCSSNKVMAGPSSSKPNQQTAVAESSSFANKQNSVAGPSKKNIYPQNAVAGPSNNSIYSQNDVAGPSDNSIYLQNAVADPSNNSIYFTSPETNIKYGETDINRIETLFLTDIVKYMEYSETNYHPEFANHTYKFFRFKEIIPHVNDKFIAKLVVRCKTDSDFELAIDNILNGLFIYNINSMEENIPQFVESVMKPPLPKIESPSVEMDNVPMSMMEIEDTIQQQTQLLLNMFIDADPDYIMTRVHEVNGNQNQFELLAFELSSSPNYPKYEDYLEKKKQAELKQKFIEGMSTEEFMEYFDGSEEMFANITTATSIEYQNNTKFQLMQDFPNHLMNEIYTVLRKNNYKYYPSYMALKNIKGDRKTKRPSGNIIGEFDDAFLKERCYVRMMDTINKHKEESSKNKQKRFAKAKEDGELRECQCCFEDELLIDDMSPCSEVNNSHHFCNECIRRYSEEQIGQSKLEFYCLQGECKGIFELSVLKNILKSSIFSNLLKRKQAEEIAAADIADLVSCPFCPFSTIMPNPEDKVFKCMNPECLKDSCRLCKERNHVPLKCAEFEKQKSVDHRTYLENEMTKAIVRVCYKCKKTFIKEEGCNKMMCPCGAVQCYLCKVAITGYNHFHDNNSNAKSNAKCPLWSNSIELHATELKNKVDQLKKDDNNIELVHNPLNTNDTLPPKTNNPRIYDRNGIEFFEVPPQAIGNYYQGNYNGQVYNAIPPQVRHNNPRAPIRMHHMQHQNFSIHELMLQNYFRNHHLNQPQPNQQPYHHQPHNHHHRQPTNKF